MATLWIHRAVASDILVEFENIEDAYNFTMKIIKNDNSDVEINMTLNELKTHPPSNDPPCMASTSYLQFSILPFGINPESFWNNIGFVKVSPEEVMALGDYKNPDGFIPHESDRIWMKETRSTEELSAELDNYMYPWRELAKFAKRILNF